MRIAIAFLLAGCLPGPPLGDDDQTPTPNPVPPVASGAYQLRSEIDLTVEALLPEQAELVVVTMRDFSTNPAHALLDLADQAGVPAVAELRAALPDPLEAQLEGMINGEIAKLKLNGVPVTTIAGDFAGLAQTALTHFAVDSELVINGKQALHALKTLDLAPAGLDVQYDLAPLPDEIATATTTCASSGGKLTLGDHSYGLPYGEYAWTALNDAMTRLYGYDIRGALGAGVNCPALATTVAAKCVLGACVGHAAELTTICERGLDEVVERVHAEFTATRFDALHFAAGTATITSAGLTNGVWTAEINVGLGLRPVPATFSATR